MPTFTFTGYVRRRVVDEVTIKVNAVTEEEAYNRAWNVLGIFPSELEDGTDVPYCYIESRDTQDAEVIGLTTKEEKTSA